MMDEINNKDLIDYHERTYGGQLQDMYPFNSTLVGLDGIYVASYDNKQSFINSPCIVTKNQTLLTGNYVFAYHLWDMALLKKVGCKAV